MNGLWKPLLASVSASSGSDPYPVIPAHAGTDPGRRLGINQILQRGSQQPPHRITVIGLSKINS